MAEIDLTAAFSSVPAPDQEAIKRLLTDIVQQLAQEEGRFTRARVVFTESDERCGLTAELDGVKKEGVPLSIDIEQIVDERWGSTYSPRSRAISIAMQRGLVNADELARENEALQQWLQSENAVPS